MAFDGVDLSLADLPDGFSIAEAADPMATVLGNDRMQDCLGMRIGVGNGQQFPLRASSASPTWGNSGGDIRVVSGQVVFEELLHSVDFFRLLREDFASCFVDQLGHTGLPVETEPIPEVEEVSYPEGVNVLAYRTKVTTQDGADVFIDSVLLQAGEVQTGFYVYSYDSPVQVTDLQGLADLVVDRLDAATA